MFYHEMSKVTFILFYNYEKVGILVLWIELYYPRIHIWKPWPLM